MSDATADRPQREPAPAEPADVTFVDYVVLVWQYRWMILTLVLLAVVPTFVLTLRMPKIYESTATLITPKEGGSTTVLGGLAAASGLLQQIPGIQLPSFTPNRDLLVAILKSRTVAQALVERFGLQERYRARYLEDAIKGLQGRTRVTISKEGVISVKVEDIDPAVAAEIANAYPEQLDRLMVRYGSGEAGRDRVFMTAQLARAKAELDGAEQALRRFQERNRAIVLQEQTRGAIEAAARFKGEIMAAEVQLQVMRNFATETNPEVIALRRRIAEMNRQLMQMQYGEDVPRPTGQRDFSVPFARVPEVGLELARLTREVKVQETLVTLLTQQVEQSRLAEARDAPTVQTLDRAVPPVRYSKPSTVLNTAIAGATSLFGGVFLAFLLEYVKRLPRRPRASRTRAASGA